MNIPFIHMLEYLKRRPFNDGRLSIQGAGCSSDCSLINDGRGDGYAASGGAHCPLRTRRRI